MSPAAVVLWSFLMAGGITVVAVVGGLLVRRWVTVEVLEALWLGTAARRIGPICSFTRIGLTREVHRKRRFFEFGNPYVSGPRSPSIS